MTPLAKILAAFKFLRNNVVRLGVLSFALCVLVMVCLYVQLNGSDSLIALKRHRDFTDTKDGVDYIRNVLNIQPLAEGRLQRRQQTVGASAAPRAGAARAPLAAAAAAGESQAHKRGRAAADPELNAPDGGQLIPKPVRLETGNENVRLPDDREHISRRGETEGGSHGAEEGSHRGAAEGDNRRGNVEEGNGANDQPAADHGAIDLPLDDNLRKGTAVPAYVDRSPASDGNDGDLIRSPASRRPSSAASRRLNSSRLHISGSAGSWAANGVDEMESVRNLSSRRFNRTNSFPDYAGIQPGHRVAVDIFGGGSLYREGTTGSPPPPVLQWKNYDYESAVGTLDIHVEHAPDVLEVAVGEPWPMPQHYLTSETYHIVDLPAFRIIPPLAGAEMSRSQPWCSRLQRAVDRYVAIVKGTVGKVTSNVRSSVLPHNSLIVSLKTPCSDEAMPHEGMDESYFLRVDAHNMQLIAVEIWGILRGLETFSQLLYIRDGSAVINETVIRDYPSYGYRGVMLDTARHFLPMEYIKKSLDAMSYNKFNVFHWHIVDDNSFPYESKKFPDLHKKGAYSSSQTYSIPDVQEIVNYAADRGIRVVPEFDTPGHTRSWGNGIPKLLTNCSADFAPFGAVNPIQEFTYDFLGAFFQEVKSVFPDSYMHIGGDEINYKCWLAVRQIRDFMIARNMTVSEYQYNGGYLERLNGKQLQGYYTERLLAVMPPSTKKIAWDEAFIAAVQQNLSRSDLVIHVWQQSDMWQQLASQVLSEGFGVIVSACWYLNYISYGIDWHKYYECDLKSFEKYYDVLPDKKKGMLGGSVCLWSEHIDENNLEPVLWPRAIAPAEKLWSSELLVSPSAAEGRFEQQHCRMLRRGIRAAPGNGPGSCIGSMKVKPPM